MDRRASRTAWISLVLCFGIAAAQGQVTSAGLWGIWEKSFVAAAAAGNEVELQVVLRSPTGRETIADGFWDGDSNWKVRFMPTETGRFSYRTRSSPAIPGLDGIAGTFTVKKSSSGSNPFFRRGALRVSADGRHLEHADGTPFFWLGDTVWNGPLLATREDWQRYLQDRISKRFSAVQFVMTAPWRTAPTHAEGEVAFTGKEKIEINPRFFKRMDVRMDEINAAGLLAVPVLLWAIRGEENPGYSLPESQAIRMLRYLVARYGAHHVVWIPAGDGSYTGEFAERWKRIGRAVFEGRPHAPTVMHPAGMQWPYEPFRGEKWMDLLGYQSGHGDDAKTLRWIHSGPVSQAWRETPRRPVLNLEPPYEDHLAYQSKQPHPAYHVRRAAYWSLLAAPLAGLTYGAHGIWSWEITAKVPLNHANSGIAKPWFEAAKLPGSAHMRVLSEFFHSIPWWQLIPAGDLVSVQPGSDDPARFVSVAATESREVVVTYLPKGEEVSLAVQASAYRATWVDPRTGKRVSARASSTGSFQAPDSQDWLLLLRRR